MRGVQSRKEVIKHSAAVQIQNNITLLQRRAWNVLLANAYDELPTEEEHRIAVRDPLARVELRVVRRSDGRPTGDVTCSSPAR